MTQAIPFLDLVTPHQELREELADAFEVALKTGGFIGGAVVEGFEREFAQYCDVQHCMGVGSGTDALRLALITAGVRPNITTTLKVTIAGWTRFRRASCELS